MSHESGCLVSWSPGWLMEWISAFLRVGLCFIAVPKKDLAVIQGCLKHPEKCGFSYVWGTCRYLLLSSDLWHKLFPVCQPRLRKATQGGFACTQPVGGPLALIHHQSLLAQKPRTSAPSSSLPTLGIQSAFTIQVKECKSPHHSLVREMGRKREPTMTPFPRRECFCSELHGSNIGCFSGKATVDSTWKGGSYYE